MVFCGDRGAKLVSTPDVLVKDTDEAVRFWDEATTACPGLVPAFGFTKKALSFI
jgi:hypothetical protein